jgi:hypothetical protein
MIDWCESHGVGLPNKSDIEHLLDVKKDLLAAADALRANMGDDAYRQFMEEVFLRPDLKPTEVHKILAKLPFVGAGTTNYDSLVEGGRREAIPGESFEVFTQVDHEQLGTALHDERFFVLKAHGTIERLETVVLGWKDYNRLIHASEGYRTFLRALFLNRTVLFLGFSMSDPELLLLLGGLKEVFKGHTPTHYALMDVTDITPTEQGQFEENYGVKIIPYTPSAPDHPEVKSFLIELGERALRQAVWYQMEEARKALGDDDPHYQVVFTTENEFILKERYPGAAEKHPLGITFTVKGEGKESVKRLEATGEPLNVKAEDIVDVKVPDIFRRYFEITGHLGIKSGVARGDLKRTVKITVECADGEAASLDNIVLEDIQSGNKKALLSNEKQDVPWKFRMVINAEDEEAPLDFTFNDVGLPVKRALEGLRFGRALSKGGFLRLENIETGDQFAHAEILPDIMPEPDPVLIRVLEALETIQKKTRVHFTSPQDVPKAMVKNIFDVERLLQTGRIELVPPSVQYTSAEVARADIARFSAGATMSFDQYADDWVFIVLDKHVSLGPVLVSCEKMIITPEDLEGLRKAAEEGLNEDKPATVRLTPAPGEVLEARLLDWIPAGEAEEIRNSPFVKTTSLNNLVGLLADAAKEGGSGLNIEEFINLLDAAKGQTSEQGVPLNRLSSATAQELGKAFELVAAELKSEEKLKLAAALFRRGWLPSAEAARLAGVDEVVVIGGQGDEQESLKTSHAEK